MHADTAWILRCSLHNTVKEQHISQRPIFTTLLQTCAGYPQKKFEVLCNRLHINHISKTKNCSVSSHVRHVNNDLTEYGVWDMMRFVRDRLHPNCDTHISKTTDCKQPTSYGLRSQISPSTCVAYLQQTLLKPHLENQHSSRFCRRVVLSWLVKTWQCG